MVKIFTIVLIKINVINNQIPYIIVVRIVWVPHPDNLRLQGGNVFELAVVKTGIKAALV